MAVREGLDGDARVDGLADSNAKLAHGAIVAGPSHGKLRFA